MDEFSVGDLVVVVKGEFDGQGGFISSLVPTADVIEVTLNNTGHRALLDPSAIRPQQ